MKSLLAVLFAGFILLGFQQIKYVKTKVNDSVTISLPEGFRLMDKTEIDRKYVAAKEPLAAYTDMASATVDIGINVAYSRWNDEDLEIMRSFYKSTIMGLYSEVQFITEEVQEIDGRKYAVFEFVSVVRDEEDASPNPAATTKYTRIHYGIINYKTILINFTCPASQRNNWSDIAKHTLESVKIGKTL